MYLDKVALKEEGEVTVKAVNLAGEASATAKLKIQSKYFRPRYMLLFLLDVLYRTCM